MELMEFQKFVKQHAIWLTGPMKVPVAQIEAAEVELSLTFPAEFTWLLSQYGIWNGTGIQAMQWIVASSQRLNSPSHVVLARTSTYQYDSWQHMGELNPSLKTSGFVVMEVLAQGVSGKVYWLRECLHEQLLDALDNPNYTQTVYGDFCDFIVKRVYKLAASVTPDYQECPLQKSLPESPLVVDHSQFPWQLFMDRLGETISWNLVRDKYALELPDELNSKQHPHWIEQLIYTQEARRHMLLVGGYKPDSYYAMIGSSCRPIIKPAENLAGGNLLLTKITAADSHSPHIKSRLPVHGQAKQHSLDAWGRPDPDYWVCQLLLNDHSSPESTPTYHLVSWIPPGKYPQTDQALKQGGYQNSIWLEQAPEFLLRHFQDRQWVTMA